MQKKRTRKKTIKDKVNTGYASMAPDIKPVEVDEEVIEAPKPKDKIWVKGEGCLVQWKKKGSKTWSFNKKNNYRCVAEDAEELEFAKSQNWIIK